MIHLNVHSNYTLLNSVATIESLVDEAVKNKMSALALTDTNGMYGLIEFYKYASEKNVKPLLGVEIDDPNNPVYKVNLIAKNIDGYSRICELITLRKLDENFSLINELNNNSNDLIITTTCLELTNILNNTNNVYIRLFSTKKRKNICRELYHYANENRIKIIADNPIYFVNKEDHLLHKVINAIRLNTTIANLPEEEFHSEEEYFKSSTEMENIWKTIPIALQNSEEIAKICNVDLRLGEYKHPTFPLSNLETPFSLLWKIAFEGLSEKYQPLTEQAIKRLQEELHIIDELGFSDYFLIVWDIAQKAKKLGMMMLGRGSAANSIVAYALGLSQIDPLKHNLYFERFLNLGRASPPDIDLDFSWKERDTIVKYIFEKYGYDKVAFISTINTFRARSAFREVAKTFGISDAEISEYSHYIPWTSAVNLPKLAEKFPEARNMKFTTEPWQSIINIAQKIANYPRFLGIHPSGIVITPEVITKYTALEYAANKGLGLIITQPDMYSIEELGLVKIDILSQRSLAVVKDTMLKISHQKEIDKTKEPKIFNL